ncbi:uncharacterized protein METZ01_LOCUS62005, partial [marine metagenome]
VLKGISLSIEYSRMLLCKAISNPSAGGEILSKNSSLSSLINFMVLSRSNLETLLFNLIIFRFAPSLVKIRFGSNKNPLITT